MITLLHDTSSGTGAAHPAPSFILHEAGARQYHWSGEGLLSVKMFLGGTAHYDVGPGSFAADDERYLLLNHGRNYTITIDSARPIESFCVFFEPGLVRGAIGSANAATASLLDDPAYGHDPAPGRDREPAFFERTYRHDGLVSPVLWAMRDAHARDRRDGPALRELLHTLADRLVAAHALARAEADRLDALRPATRYELYRRLHRARDFAEAMHARPVTLDEIARAACLSPNHLLRTFRQAFGLTPNAYLTRIRLDRARRLIETTTLTIGEIVMLVGYESVGTFSSRFRRAFGVAPVQLRRRKGDIEEQGSDRSP